MVEDIATTGGEVSTSTTATGIQGAVDAAIEDALDAFDVRLEDLQQLEADDGTLYVVDDRRDPDVAVRLGLTAEGLGAEVLDEADIAGENWRRMARLNTSRQATSPQYD